MGKEIERKFLVRNTSFRAFACKCLEMAQGYISTNVDSTVRVRIADEHAYLTIKSRNVGIVRSEWEYEIPISDAFELLRSLTNGKFINKTRYIVPFDGLLWEVDVFHEALEGLVVAEVELPSEDTEIAVLPEFIGTEVTGDQRYYNSELVRIMTIPE